MINEESTGNGRDAQADAAKRKRRGHGEGSITPRGENVWLIRVDAGVGSDGKRKQKAVTFHGGAKAARAELDRLKNEARAGTLVGPARLTVAQFLEQWLDFVQANVAAKTHARYAEILRDNLIPGLGHHALGKLQPLHIQQFYTSSLQAPRRDRRAGQGISPKTVLHFHRTLHAALQLAVKWQLLGRNPSDSVQPPRPEDPELRVLSTGETVRLLEAARGTATHLPLLLALATGLRRGELVALKWEDLNLEAGTLQVRRSLEATKGRIAFKPPKTQKSRRQVTLPAFAVEALIGHRGRQAEHRLRTGPAYQDQGLIFANDLGGPIHPDSFSTMIRRLAAKAGLEGVNCKSLRHTHASQLGEAGVPLKVISERLGHASVAITGDIYSHLLPGMQEDAARKIDAALRAAF